jgi:D-alanine--D-alanine ligase
MSGRRREQLVALCRETGIPIIEDNPYGLLRFDGEPLPCLRSLDPRNVIYLGTVSKTFSPGVRVGWALADPSVIQRLVLAKEAADLCGSNFTMLITERWFSDDVRWRTALTGLVDTYRARRDAMLDALEEHFPGMATWTRPSGGFYVWVTLPEWFRHDRDARGSGGATGRLRPGTAFYPDARGADRMRLAYCYPTEDRIREGVAGSPPSSRTTRVCTGACTDHEDRDRGGRPDAGTGRLPPKRTSYDTLTRRPRHEGWLLDPAEVPLVEALAERRPDLCWLALHGKEGEDGTVQRLLDLLEIPYTGTAAFDCEVAFDKVLAKDALRRAGVPTPPWVVIEGWALRDLGGGAALGKAVERIGLPCVVKPSRSGSALGMSFVEREADLPQAVMAALSFSGAALIEAKVEGREVAAALVGADLEPLPLVEIVPKEGIYDYAARYTAGATDYFCPSRTSQGASAAVAEAASTAASALRLRDLTRSTSSWIRANSPGCSRSTFHPHDGDVAGTDGRPGPRTHPQRRV